MRTRDIVAALGLTPAPAPPPYLWTKCVRCRRPYVTTPAGLTKPCPMCAPAPDGLTFGDHLLRIEFGLTVKAYLTRLEKYGPPWIAPKEWITPRKKWPKLRPPPDVADPDD